MDAKRRIWALYLAMTAAASALYMLGPGLLHSGPFFNAIGAAAIFAIVAGTRNNRARRPLPWMLFALALTLFVAGDVIAYNWTRFFGGELPYPSPADALYLLVYPSLIAGLLILIRERSPARDRASLLDSLIVATGAAVLSWIFLIAPYAHDATLSLPTKLTSIAYPIADLLLLGVVVRLAMGGGRRGTAFYLLVGGAGALLVTDAIFGWLLLHGGYTPGGLLDLGWIVFYATWAGAALHPSIEALSDEATEPTWALSRSRLMLMSAASLIAPAGLTVRLVQGVTADAVLIAGAAIVLFTLVLIRMVGLVQHNEQTARREVALREAGVALVSASSREEIYAASLDGACRLAGGASPTYLCLADDLPGEFGVVASAGEHAERPWAAYLRLGDLPEEASARLRRRQSCTLDAAQLAACGFGAGSQRSGWVVPLFMRHELHGTILIVGSAAIGRAVRDAISALAAEVALALESAALTEDLVRRESDARYRSMFQHSGDLVCVIGPDATFMYVSPSVERLFDHAIEAIEGAPFDAIVHPEDVPRVCSFLAALEGQAQGASSVIEFRMLHGGGTWVHVETHATNLLEHPNVGGIVLNARDVSERKAFEEQLTFQAFHDALTGLPNRALFRNRVEHALERQRRGERGIAVLFLDIDDFKTVNDRLGHMSGDELLRAVGRRLQAAVRGADTAARLGGDEFAVLLEGVGDEPPAELADRLIAVMGEPYVLDGVEITAQVSIGIAIGDADGRGEVGAEELLRNADTAMYTAKEQGKGRYQIFDPEMQAAVLERLALKSDLKRAIEKREFIVHYQPIVELQTNLVTGFEALVRWEHPERGMVSPGEFIPLAEDTGLILGIGALVLHEACHEAVRLQSICPQEPALTMSVNLSGRQLQQPDIAAQVATALAESGLAPDRLLLEVTESTLMTDVDLAVVRFEELRALGVRLAIDDFGTGYSSLNYIRQFPFNVLKIDKSFIDDLGAGDGDGDGGAVSALTAAIIDLAGILDLAAIAEGIETPAQLERLIGLNCCYGQGFLLHRPLPTHQIEQLAASQAADRAVLVHLTQEGM